MYNARPYAGYIQNESTGDAAFPAMVGIQIYGSPKGVNFNVKYDAGSYVSGDYVEVIGEWKTSGINSYNLNSVNGNRTSPLNKVIYLVFHFKTRRSSLVKISWSATPYW